MVTSTPVTFAFLKLGAETCNRYFPGGNRVAAKPPSSPVVKVRTDFPVISLMTSTVAQATRAPFLSVTTPVIPPVCLACADTKTTHNPTSNPLDRKRTRLRITASLRNVNEPVLQLASSEKTIGRAGEVVWVVCE